MRFKFLIIFIFFMFALPVNAQQWVKTDTQTGTVVYLDVDSIVDTKSGTFFNIMYYSKQAREQVICMVYMVGNQAGVVKTMKLSEYTKKKMNYKKVSLYDAKLKVYDSDSAIYNACEMVKKMK